MPKNNSKTATAFILTSIKISALSFLAETVFLSVAALILLKSDFIPSKSYFIISYLIFSVASGICAIMSARTANEKTALNCFVSQFCLLIFNYISILILSGFKLEIKSLILIPVSIVVTVLCIILNNGRKRKHK